MRYFAFFLCSMYFLLSCTNHQDSIPSITEDYFPLEVGNYWDYGEEGSTTVLEVVSLDGKEYYELESFYNGVKSSDYYRKEDHKVYIKYGIDNEEELLYDFSAKIGSSWGDDWLKTGLFNRSASLEINGMNLSDCFVFNTFSPDNQVQDADLSVYLAPDIGLVKMVCGECYGGNGGKELREAKIGSEVIKFY